MSIAVTIRLSPRQLAPNQKSISPYSRFQKNENLTACLTFLVESYLAWVADIDYTAN